MKLKFLGSLLLIFVLLFHPINSSALVTAETPRISYVAGGGIADVTFYYSFKIFQSTDLLVYDDNILQTLNVHYTVSMNTGGIGGTVTFVTAPIASSIIDIVRSIPLTQNMDLREGDRLPAETLESTLDKQTMTLQDLNSKLNAFMAGGGVLPLDPTVIWSMINHGGFTLKSDDLFTKSPWVDVRSFMDGVAGRPTYATWYANQATTDVSSVLEAANTAAKGIVLFPSGIYAISRKFVLKTNTAYIGSQGGTFPPGQEHPIAGYGACLKWIGAASGVMVEAKNILNTVWDGIDLDGVDYTNNVTGIFHYSDGVIGSQQCKFKNFWAFNFGYGMKIGDNTGGEWQTDNWIVENFRFYKVNYGFKLNSQNGTQNSRIKGGYIGCYHRGIDIENIAGLSIQDIAFNGMGNAAADSAWIYINSHVQEIELDNITGETIYAGWYDVLFAPGAISAPVLLKNSYIVGGIVTQTGVSAKITSLNNHYATGLYENTGIVLVDANTFVSINDTYSTANDHVHETGLYNFVNYIHPNFVGQADTNYVAYRYTFNTEIFFEIKYPGHFYLATGANRATGTLTLDANAASTTVGNTIVTANSLIYLFPVTANAAADVGGTGVYISAKVAATSFTITHPNNANADKTFNYLIIN